MYITDIWIKLFQIHNDLHIRLVPGFNCIVGESEKGKSAIIRALALLFTSKPKGGEKLFKQWFQNKQPTIKIRDNYGNIIKRQNNKYYVNDIELKALNNELPDPVNQLISLNETNWQRQHDSFFMIFKPGGGAAKALDKVLDIEDYLLLVEEIKKRRSKKKKDNEYLKDKNEGLLKSFKNMEVIPEFLDKLNIIQETHNQVKKYESDINKITNIIEQLESINKYKKEKKIIKIINNKSNILVTKVKEYKILEQKLITLNQLTEDLLSINYYINQKDNIKYLIQEIKNLISKLNEFNQLTININKLSNLIMSIRLSANQHKQALKESSEAKILLDKKFKELGYCPLCNTKKPKGNYANN